MTLLLKWEETILKREKEKDLPRGQKNSREECQRAKIPAQKKKKAARYLFPYLCRPSTKNHAWGKRGTSKIFAEWVKSWGSILWGSLSSWALPTVYWDQLATEEARAPPGQSLPGSDIQWGDIRHSPLHSRQVFGKRADVTSLGSTSIFVLLNRAIKEEAIWQNN